MYKCEKCGIDVIKKFSSGRFCSKKCARSFSTKAKRKEINQKVSENFKQKKINRKINPDYQKINRLNISDIIYKYYFIYKTTCIITNKFYIGMHCTNNIEDDYLGSGKYLWNSIVKYGKENHKREILEYLLDRKTLIEREKSIVNENLLSDNLCMNLKLGGEGGATHKNVKIWITHNELGNKLIKKEEFQSYLDLGWIKGRKFTNTSNFKSLKGEKSFLYDRVWIKHPELKSRSIKKEDLENYLQLGWEKGRKM